MIFEIIFYFILWNNEYFLYEFIYFMYFTPND